ncbi:hypothetical protein [Burkholderia latens]|uniref:hypothetical protein n=1 Tax=Burkholderia latens TaxID=488446 RepID=UPI001ABA5838|nr:hypothetical protein [Burkholderia latens]
MVAGKRCDDGVCRQIVEKPRAGRDHHAVIPIRIAIGRPDRFIGHGEWRVDGRTFGGSHDGKAAGIEHGETVGAANSPSAIASGAASAFLSMLSK